jgi:hypothetical protein
VFQTVQTALQIAGALAGGALFTVGPAYAFLSITAICLLSALSPLAYRRGQKPPVPLPHSP